MMHGRGSLVILLLKRKENHFKVETNSYTCCQGNNNFNNIC